MACFTPALGCAHSVVQGRSLTFVAHSVPDEWTPELWTNIDGAWRAIAFEAEPSGDVYTLELTFPQRTSNQEVEFTYRLSCGTDVWWFGSEQSNGRIRVVAPQKPFAKVHRFQVNEGLEQFFPIDLGDSKDFDAGLVWERTACANGPCVYQKNALTPWSADGSGTHLASCQDPSLNRCRTGSKARSSFCRMPPSIACSMRSRPMRSSLRSSSETASFVLVLSGTQLHPTLPSSSKLATLASVRLHQSSSLSLKNLCRPR